MPVTDLLQTAAAPAAPADPAPGPGAAGADRPARRRRQAVSAPTASPPATAVTSSGPLLTRDDAESLRRLGVEIEVVSPHGTFWLVPRRTSRTDRVELTPEDAVAIGNLVLAFDGRVAALTRDGQLLPDATASVAAHAAGLVAPGLAPVEPATADARDHLRRLRERVTDQAAGGEAPAQPSLFEDV